MTLWQMIRASIADELLSLASWIYPNNPWRVILLRFLKEFWAAQIGKGPTDV